MPRPLMPHPAAPPRVARGSRVAGMAAAPARLILAALAAMLFLVAVATAGGGSPPEGQSAATVHGGLIDAVASGGDYYLAAADASRAADRSADPLTIRLPTLTMIATIVPTTLLTPAMWLLACATVAVWYRRLALPFTSASVQVMALLLPLAGVAAVVLRPEATLVHEGWAGLFVALSLGLRQPGRAGRTVVTAALGLAAALIHQAAGLYLLVMALSAAGERRRREAAGWGAALVAFGVVLGFHLWATMRAGGLDLLTEAVAHAGPIAAIGAVAGAIFPALPVTVTAPLVMLALAGWAARRGGSATRVVMVLGGFLLVVAGAPAADAGETALLVAPLALTGLVFAGGMIRDLVRAALDRRRITVRRIVR